MIFLVKNWPIKSYWNIGQSNPNYAAQATYIVQFFEALW